MKRKIFGIHFFALLLLFFGCASNQVATENQNPKTDSDLIQSDYDQSDFSEPELNQEKDFSESQISSKYDDWKYKGFGTELPEWIEPALEYDFDSVKEMLDLPQDSLIRILYETGINVDQCEQKMNENAGDFESDFEVVQAFWVRLNQKDNLQQEPYISIRVYLQNDDVLEILN